MIPNKVEQLLKGLKANGMKEAGGSESESPEVEVSVESEVESPLSGKVAELDSLVQEIKSLVDSE